MKYNVGDKYIHIKQRSKLLDLLICSNNSKFIPSTDIQNTPSNIIDIYDLASAVNINVNDLFKCLLNKDKYQVKMVIGDKKRVVYKSIEPLYSIQKYISNILTDVYKIIDCTHLLAYISGCNYVDKLKEIKGSYSILISMDIKKYFDTITRQHINTLLADVLGYNKTFSNMLSKLVTVNGTHPIYGYKGNFLQQGSIASPVLSNLIGYFFYDTQIIPLLKEYETKLRSTNGKAVTIEYLRYCDNLYIGIKNSTDIINAREIVSKIKDIMKTAGFKIHKDKVVTQTHPYIAQQILGIVINNEAKVETKQFNNMEAKLINIIAGNLSNFESNMVNIYDNSKSNLVIDANPLNNKGKVDTAMLMLRGVNNYYKSINTVQGAKVTNLMEIIERIYAAYNNDISKITDHTYIMHNNTIPQQETLFIMNLNKDKLNNTPYNNLTQVKKEYVLNKVRLLFHNLPMEINDSPNILGALNVYINVNSNNRKVLSKCIYKVLSNYRTNRLLMCNILPIVEDNISEREYPVNELTNVYQIVPESNDKLYHTLLIKLPIYDDISISKEVNNLLNSNNPHEYDMFVNKLYSGSEVLINVVLVTTNTLPVNQSYTQLDNCIRSLYNYTDNTDISSKVDYILKRDPLDKYIDIAALSINRLLI